MARETAQMALTRPLRSVHRVKPSDANQMSTIAWVLSYVFPCLVSAMGSKIVWTDRTRVPTAESSE